MRHRRAVVLIAVVLVGGAFVVSGLGVRPRRRASRRSSPNGALGPIVFVLAMWALQPAGVPGLVFMIPASVVWPLPLAMSLSWVGNMGASTIAFAMARWLARDWAQNHLPTRLRAWDDRLSDGGCCR
ncbi:MAG: hypothetical protein R2695_12195 [Acidimicrobiales bacterium]